MAIAGLAALQGGAGGLDFGSSATTGDQRSSSSSSFNFTGPSIGDNSKVVIYVAVALAAYLIAKKIRVL